jgi:hypothetical protein
VLLKMADLFSHVQMGDKVEIIARHANGKVFAKYDSSKRPFGKMVKAFLKFMFTGKKTYNSMTNAGFAVTSSLLYGTGTAFTAVAIGTGTTAAAATQTALLTETKRKAGSISQVTTTVTNDTSQWDATFSSADSLSGTSAITEVGIFNNNTSGGTLLLRQVFSAINLNWDTGDSLQMIVKCQSKQGT